MENYVALDCEMVGLKTNRGTSMLAQVSIVGSDGEPLYNEFVKPPPTLNLDTIDYRTLFSGITKEILQTRARYSFAKIQSDVKGILQGKTIVGHALENDFRALQLDPSNYTVMDTAHAPWFMQIRWDPRSLKRLAADLLENKQIQTETHNALEDARTSMELFRKYQEKFRLTPAEAIADRGMKKGGTRRRDRRRRYTRRR
jgi:RNA exonuclease 4